MAIFLRIFVLAAVGCLGVEILVFGKRARGNRLGDPPIAKPAFALAKLGASVSIFLLILRAITGPAPVSMVASAACAVLLLGGTVIFTMGIARLGGSLRVGLPQEDTALVTTGIYAFTRNPIYVGMSLVMGASLIFAFSWLNIVAVILGVALHHFIVLAEERFLLAQFKDYEAYCRKVRRYWGRRKSWLS